MICKTAYACDELGLNVGYTLPSDDFAAKFVTEKVDGIIANNPYLQSLIGDTDSKSMKQIGGRFAYFQGTFGEMGAISHTLDMLMHDEDDRSNQKVIGQYQSRMDFSKFKRTIKFSNPSAPAIGVGAKWRISDQQHWMVTCDNCGHESYMDWFGGKTRGKRNHTVHKGKRIYVCGECAAMLPDDARRYGRWRAKYPSRYQGGLGWRGYWINQMFVPWLSASDLINKERNSSTEYFYNFVLGLPYRDQAASVDREVIYSAYSSRPNSRTGMAMGVDSGVRKHYVVGNIEGIVEVGVCDTWEEILQVQQRYQAKCVIDSGPDITEPRRFIKALSGTFFIANYQRDRAMSGNIRYGLRDRRGWVYIDKHKTIQEVMEMWVERRIKINIRPQDISEEFIKHYENMARIKDVDSLGRPVYRWEADNGEDHFVNATVYWRAALERAGRKSRVLSPRNAMMDTVKTYVTKQGDLVIEDVAGSD